MNNGFGQITCATKETDKEKFSIRTLDPRSKSSVLIVYSCKTNLRKLICKFKIVQNEIKRGCLTCFNRCSSRSCD